MDEKKYFDIDEEMMIDYAEMTSFNFDSPAFLACSGEVPAEYAHQKFTFKYGNFDVLDMLQSMFAKTSSLKG